ncbi:unnamed protein product [Meganyctiphanes norvegica]|uniref:Potassium channel domain-containing protein n=1 Tax=Meganyctiphanes norvegica TaxID=48144 RepID=A0AAV2QA26_MEGNR
MRESEDDKCGQCGYYVKAILKFLVSHIGLVSLVIGYTIIGGFTFEHLEAEHELEVKKNMSKGREKVTNDLWDITEEMKVLNESQWAGLVREELKRFERTLIKAIKTNGWDGSEDLTTQQWTFAGALFYSIILITTIGYGHIAPKTPWGKVVTIFYAIPGVPLMMLCLANIGDGMAHSFRFLYWKVCCYVCVKKPKKKQRRPKSIRGSTKRYPPSHPGSQRIRSSSFRRSQRASQKSADSRLSDSAFFSRGSYSDAEYSARMYDDMLDTDLRVPNRTRPHSDSGHAVTRPLQNSKTPDQLTPPPKDDLQDSNRVAVLFNKYALEKEGIAVPDNGQKSPQPIINEQVHQNQDRDLGTSHNSDKDQVIPELAVTQQPRPKQPGPPPAGYQDSPPMPHSPRDSGRYSRHLPPPDPRGRMSRLEEEYYYDDYYDDYDDDEDDEDPTADKPVPIWLGVMLVVAYIFGGAFLFSGWEQWGFLDSVYFCFITLTTIGFGDFVPAQKLKSDVELSIALCSLYLLFGIALLAMSFNLVQEEVISNVKSVAKRLGIIKDDEEEDEEE